jgi:hypothetical protein
MSHFSGRHLFAASAAILLLSAMPAFAAKGPDAMKACAAAWKAMPAADQGKTTYKAYSADCLKAGGPKTDAAAVKTPAAATNAAMSGPMSPQDRMKSCAAKWKAMSAADKGKTTYKAYSSTCLKAS